MVTKPENSTQHVCANKHTKLVDLEDSRSFSQWIIPTIALMALAAMMMLVIMPILEAQPRAFEQSQNRSSCGSWQSTATLEIGSGNGLRGIAVLSRNDIWTVGSMRSFIGPVELNTSQALIQHWNGTAWNTLPLTPATSGRNFYLSGMAAISSSNIWAVGESYKSETPDGHTLIAHWDGLHWNIVESPNSSQINNNLNAAAAADSANVWAVGSYADTNYVSRVLLLHWGGSKWETWNSGLDSIEGELFDIAIISKADIWAVGYHMNNQKAQPLALRWNGTDWMSIPMPISGKTSILHRIAAISKDDVWAVGSSEEGGTTFHWNGKVWSVVPNPSSSSGGTSLNGVAGANKDDVWVVGHNQNNNQPMSLHWDGKRWSEVTSPQSMLGGGLFNVANDFEHGVWVVGHSFSNQSGSYYALASHFTGTPCPATTKTSASKP